MKNFEDIKIAVAGTGYVGLSIATLLSQHHKVTAVDVVPEKVEKINNRLSPIQDEYIEKFLAEKDLDLHATLDGREAYRDADFVVVAAPTNYDPVKNYFDTSHVEEVIDLVLEVRPNQVTLVPDATDAITSNSGWDTLANKDFLTKVCKRFKDAGIRTSIFINPEPEMARGAAECGADRVELYTEPYATLFPTSPEQAVEPFVRTAEAAKEYGLGVNAGHDLNLDNLEFFIRNIPWTAEVSIGHAVICDALYMGLEKTIEAYLKKVKIFFHKSIK